MQLFKNAKDIFEGLPDKLKETDTKSLDNHKVITFGIPILDNHIATVLKNTEASFAQVALVAFAVFGFILAHGGIKNTSLYIIDYSITGSGKSSNISMQIKLLLKSIMNQQDELQRNTDKDEGPKKRYANVHLGQTTVAALFQCLATVRAQFMWIDEIGLTMQKDNDMVTEITKLYGATDVPVPILKTEEAASKSLVASAFTFIGASTLTYAGSPAKMIHHILGGFINRAFIVYNKELKAAEDITSFQPANIDTEPSNTKALELLSFAKNTPTQFEYDEDSSAMMVKFKQEIQTIVLDFNSLGNNDFSPLYARTIQNTIMVINILHVLKCFENNHHNVIIDTTTVTTAISFVKTVVFTEIDKLMDYLTDKELLSKEEKQITRVKAVVAKHYTKYGYMPTIRYVTQNSQIRKDELLTLTKGYLELTPESRILRYCSPSLASDSK